MYVSSKLMLTPHCSLSGFSCHQCLLGHLGGCHYKPKMGHVIAHVEGSFNHPYVVHCTWIWDKVTFKSSGGAKNVRWRATCNQIIIFFRYNKQQ